MKTILLRLWKVLKLPPSVQLFVMRRVNDKFLIGVTGVIINADDEVLLVKHTYRSQENWSLPGGYIKENEHPKEGLEREIKEETGFVVSADIRLKIRTDRKLTARLDIAYAGSLLGGQKHTSEETEKVKFFAFNDLPLLPSDQLVFIKEGLRKHKRYKTRASQMV